jgi:predicted ester cyclase
MAQDNGMIVRGFVDEVITKGNIEAAAKYIWEDVIEQVPLPGQGPGLNGLKDTIRAMRAGFPDIVFSIHEQIVEGDKVVSRFEWTGTHKGSFLGIPPTGRPVRVWGMVIDWLKDDRVKDTRILMDILGMLTQLGVLPPLTTP